MPAPDAADDVMIFVEGDVPVEAFAAIAPPADDGIEAELEEVNEDNMEVLKMLVLGGCSNRQPPEAAADASSILSRLIMV